MMLASNGYKYIIHGRDHLSSWAEAQVLKMKAWSLLDNGYLKKSYVAEVA